MYRTTNRAAMAALLLALAPAAAAAQSHKNVTLHVNPRWAQCAIQLDSSLKQVAWRQFTREAGLVAYFRPLTDARPMGRGRFEVSMLQWQTGIDDETSAWNDTFVHPYATHWLFEGHSGLSFPGIAVRAGLTSRLDLGVYYTRNVQSNYGFYAGQLQYNVLHDTASRWDGAVRVSYMSLFGPEDVDLKVYGADAVASRTWALTSWSSLSPYAGVSAYLSRSHAMSPVVTLADESVGGMQAMIGAVVQVRMVRIAAELNTAEVNSRSLKIGVAF